MLLICLIAYVTLGLVFVLGLALAAGRPIPTLSDSGYTLTAVRSTGRAGLSRSRRHIYRFDKKPRKAAFVTALALKAHSCGGPAGKDKSDRS